METRSKMRLKMDFITNTESSEIPVEVLPISPVQIVTVKSKSKLFKGDEAANAIELIEVEEHGFDIVAGKDLYEVGDKAIYIQPDYNLSDLPIFQTFIAPNGDPKKSKLGSNNRIRAIKFNFRKENSEDAVYSQGIMIPLVEILGELGMMDMVDSIKTLKITKSVFEAELTEKLKITKWEAPEERVSGGNPKGGHTKDFPEGLYKTDETNINNCWGRIKYPVELVGTEKCDGSSITIFYKKGRGGICSRKYEIDIFKKIVVGKRELSLFDKIKKLLGFRVDVNIYEEGISESDFIQIGLPYMKKMIEYCDNNNIKDIALRGELNGKGLKGSGNKNNPSTKDEPNVKFYGLDDFSGRAIKLGEEEFNNLMTALDFQRCKVVFNKTFNSKEEICDECNNYFKNNLIEGLVLRTLDSKTSFKFMNPKYDSNK